MIRISVTTFLVSKFFKVPKLFFQSFVVLYFYWVLPYYQQSDLNNVPLKKIFTETRII
jgi:hypothetical protein